MSLAIGLREAGHHLEDPTPEERVRIEQVLRAAGFRGWDEIELDDDGWDVDDAGGPDGRELGLKLDPNSLESIRRTED